MSNPAGLWWESREFFATQNRIISSRVVAEKVVRKLSLDQNADFWNIPANARREWKGEPVSKTAQILQGLTTVNPERDTRIVHVLVKDRDPERAKLLANTIVDAYIEKTMEDRLSNTTGALEWLGKHLDTLKTELERSELALHDFTEHHSNLAVSLDDQQNIVAGNIKQLSEQLTQAKTKRIELAARVEELKLANVEDPMRGAREHGARERRRAGSARALSSARSPSERDWSSTTATIIRRSWRSTRRSRW